MDVVMENNCKNVFSSDIAEITDVFTKLWTQVINEKENNLALNQDVQTNVL